MGIGSHHIRSYFRILSDPAKQSTKRSTSTSSLTTSEEDVSHATQRSSIESPTFSERNGFLLPFFPNKEEIREMVTHFRSPKIERIPDKAVLSYHKPSRHPASPHSWRLHGNLRSTGCLFSNPYSTEISQISQIQCRRHLLSIQGLPLWSKISPSHLYEMSSPRGSPPEAKRFPGIPVSRRLAHKSTNCPSGVESNKGLSALVPTFRFTHQLSEVTLHLSIRIMFLGAILDTL